MIRWCCYTSDHTHSPPQYIHSHLQYSQAQQITFLILQPRLHATEKRFRGTCLTSTRYSISSNCVANEAVTVPGTRSVDTHLLTGGVTHTASRTLVNVCRRKLESCDFINFNVHNNVSHLLTCSQDSYNALTNSQASY
jgi:hypothetical protein